MPVRPARVGRVGVIRAPGGENGGSRQGRHTGALRQSRNGRGSRRRHTRAPADLDRCRSAIRRSSRRHKEADRGDDLGILAPVWPDGTA